MGQCYENDQLGMTEGAIRCYRRAAENGDREGEPLNQPQNHSLFFTRLLSLMLWEPGSWALAAFESGWPLGLADPSLQWAVGRGPAVLR